MTTVVGLFNDLTHLTNLLLSLEAKPPHFTSAHASNLLGSFLPFEEENVYIALRRLVGLKTHASEPEAFTDNGGEEDTPAIRELRRTITRTQGHLSSLLLVLDHQSDSGKDVLEDAGTAKIPLKARRPASARAASAGTSCPNRKRRQQVR